MLPRLDTQQRLRLRRLKMAIASYMMWVSIGVGAMVVGQLDIDRAILHFVLGGIVVTNLYFYVMIRTGLNQRLSDPSMTFQQILVALCWAMVLMATTDEARGAMLPVYIITILFGVFGLTPRAFVRLAFFALVSYGAVIGIEYSRSPAEFDLRQEALRSTVLAASLIWCTLFGSYVTQLKEALKSRNNELKEKVTNTSREASRDHLTQTFNRRYMMDSLSREKDRADKVGSTFSLCIFDLDHFKRLNDEHGHLVGDKVLADFAYLARRELRASDVIDLDGEGRCFGRFGGEEFLCLLPSTDRNGARRCAERLRVATSRAEFGNKVHVTLSAGVAEYRHGESVTETLRRADEALYFAKQTGRNRVACAGRREGDPITDTIAGEVVQLDQFRG
jgi:diguanylate cyclase (GGDEF)-like protein